MATTEINPDIVERHYQTRAIRRIGETFEKDHQRKALLVMTTGAGKTRTVIALCDLLLRCNWVKRVLFLADRVALVNQAVGAFKKWQAEKMGRDVNPSYLIQLLMQAGVKRVEVRAPAFATVKDNQVAKIGTTTVTNGGAESE